MGATGIFVIVGLALAGSAIWYLVTPWGRFHVVFGGSPSDVCGDGVATVIGRKRARTEKLEGQLASLRNHEVTDGLFDGEAKTERELAEELKKAEKDLDKAVALAKRFGFKVQ